MKLKTAFSILDRNETDKGYSIIEKSYFDTSYSIYCRGISNRVTGDNKGISLVDLEFNRLIAQHSKDRSKDTNGAIYLEVNIMARESITQHAQRVRRYVKPSISNIQKKDKKRYVMRRNYMKTNVIKPTISDLCCSNYQSISNYDICCGNLRHSIEGKSTFDNFRRLSISIIDKSIYRERKYYRLSNLTHKKNVPISMKNRILQKDIDIKTFYGN